MFFEFQSMERIAQDSKGVVYPTQESVVDEHNFRNDYGVGCTN